MDTSLSNPGDLGPADEARLLLQLFQSESEDGVSHRDAVRDRVARFPGRKDGGSCELGFRPFTDPDRDWHLEDDLLVVPEPLMLTDFRRFVRVYSSSGDSSSEGSGVMGHEAPRHVSVDIN